MTTGFEARATTSSKTALKRPAPYKLSALLQGHEDDVRCVTADRRSSRLASASRDGSARLWAHVSTPARTQEWQQTCVWRQGHEGFVNAVAFVPPIDGQGNGESVAEWLLHIRFTDGLDPRLYMYALQAILLRPALIRLFRYTTSRPAFLAFRAPLQVHLRPTLDTLYSDMHITSALSMFLTTGDRSRARAGT